MPDLEGKIVSKIVVYLDESAQNLPSYLYAKQYDANSRFINVKLMTAGGQYRAVGTCQLNAVKPNGTHVYVSGTNNPDGTVTFGLAANILTHVGNVSCDISIFDIDDSSQALLTSSVFYIVVDKSNYDADAIEGADEFSIPKSAADININESNEVFLIDCDGGRIGNGFMLPSQVNVCEIIIPADGWISDADSSAPTDGFRYCIDVQIPQARSEHFPNVTLHKTALETAKAAGLCQTAQTFDGVLRLWARSVPAQDMAATVMLLMPYGGTS